jgi:hypothetical protein
MKSAQRSLNGYYSRYVMMYLMELIDRPGNPSSDGTHSFAGCTTLLDAVLLFNSTTISERKREKHCLVAMNSVYHAQAGHLSLSIISPHCVVPSLENTLLGNEGRREMGMYA